MPSAWMSLFIYAAMGVSAFIALVWRIKLAEVVAMASAPIGAAFTFTAKQITWMLIGYGFVASVLP